MMKKLILSLCFCTCNTCLFTLFAQSNVSVTDSISDLSEQIRMKHVPDRRLGVFEFRYDLSDNGQLTVRGETSSPEGKNELLEALRQRGYSVIDSSRILPDAERLDGKTWGVINLSVCNLRHTDDFSSEMLTQGLLGMPVRVLDRRSWYRVQTPDKYIAWVHRAGVVPMTPEELNAWNCSEKIVVTSHYGFVHEAPDERTQTVSDVVAGDRLKFEGREGDFYRVSYPDGRVGYLSSRLSSPEKAWRESIRQHAQSIIATAKTLMGVPYLWAGTSSKGVDCSGFVRTVLYMHDIIMPRDASQQAFVGTHIDIDPDFGNLLPGDLIFFGQKGSPEKRERIVHVAIYIGNKQFIHSQGDVRIGSFEPADPHYDEYNHNRLLFATRFLDDIGTEEISTTLTNPFYIVE